MREASVPGQVSRRTFLAATAASTTVATTGLGATRAQADELRPTYGHGYRAGGY